MIRFTCGWANACGQPVRRAACGGRIAHQNRTAGGAPYGSLALTGEGHGTDKAVLLGLKGELPEMVDVESVADRVAAIGLCGRLQLRGTHGIQFDIKGDLLFHRTETLPVHPNGMRFIACDISGAELIADTSYSVGGGFVVDECGTQSDSQAEAMDKS